MSEKNASGSSNLPERALSAPPNISNDAKINLRSVCFRFGKKAETDSSDNVNRLLLQQINSVYFDNERGTLTLVNRLAQRTGLDLYWTLWNVNVNLRGIPDKVLAYDSQNDIIVVGFIGSVKSKTALERYCRAAAIACADTAAAESKDGVWSLPRVYALVVDSVDFESVDKICLDIFEVEPLHPDKQERFVERILCHALTCGEKICRVHRSLTKLREEMAREKNEIFARMVECGLRELAGKYFRYVLEKEKSGRICCYDKLAREYPAAYKACVKIHTRPAHLRVLSIKEGGGDRYE